VTDLLPEGRAEEGRSMAARSRPATAAPAAGPPPAWTFRPRLLGHLVRTGARGLAVWSVSIALLVTLYVSLWPSMADQAASYARLFDNLPEAYQAIFSAAGAGDLSTAVGFFNAELFLLTAPLLLVIWATVTGARAVAVPEDQGRLDLWLAHPVSRGRWYTEQAAFGLFGVLVLSAAIAGTLIAGTLALDLGLTVSGILAATGHLAALAFVFVALAVAVGGATGRPAFTRVTVAGVALAGYLVNALAPMATWLDQLRWLSPFRYGLGDNPLADGAHGGSLAVLLVTAAVVLVLGAMGFLRRDVRG
jgi:ABC-2 type transport system permease protein